jgi:hypothetical protein
LLRRDVEASNARDFADFPVARPDFGQPGNSTDYL